MSETSVGMLGSIVLVSSETNSAERLTMYEFTMPYLRKESVSLVSAITSENARVPLLMIFFMITAFYQLYWKEGAPCNPQTRKNKKGAGNEEAKDDTSIMKGFREHARKHGKLTP